MITGAGHVTAGGSICIEALTLSGTNGSWSSQYNVESILNIVMMNMIGGTPSCGQHSARSTHSLKQDLHKVLHVSQSSARQQFLFACTSAIRVCMPTMCVCWRTALALQANTAVPCCVTLQLATQASAMYLCCCFNECWSLKQSCRQTGQGK